MNIHVRIDRLILEGVPVGFAERPALQAAVETEIARLIAERGLASGLLAGGARAEARGDAIGMTGAGAADLGTRIGRAVYEGMNR